MLHCCKKKDCSCLSNTPHLDRVIAVGRDYQSSSSHHAGAITLWVQKGLCYSEWSRFTPSVLTHPMVNNKLILFKDTIDDLLESSIISTELDIFLDYSFGSLVLRFSSISNSQLFVCRVFNSKKKSL